MFQEIKCNKSTLNKMLNWSSSRYNMMKKSDVVNEIIFSVEKGEDISKEYTAGSYTENSRLTGRDYMLDIKDGVAVLTEVGSERTSYLLKKQEKNVFYVGAKQIEVVEQKFDWHKQIIGKEFDVLDETVDSFIINVMLDDKLCNMRIDKKLVQVIE